MESILSYTKDYPLPQARNGEDSLRNPPVEHQRQINYMQKSIRKDRDKLDFFPAINAFPDTSPMKKLMDKAFPISSKDYGNFMRSEETSKLLQEFKTQRL